MIEAGVLIKDLDGVGENIRNFFRPITRNKAISGIIIACNTVMITEMLVFNYGLDQWKERNDKMAKCITQGESTAILMSTRNPMEKYLKGNYAVRLVYIAESQAKAARSERDRLRQEGYDVSAAPADNAYVYTGQVGEDDCRVDVKFPYSP